MNPTINNSFLDDATGIPFCFCCDRQLSSGEAAIMARFVISREKDFLFSSWKEKPENKNWTGDETQKKEELFHHHNRAKSLKLIFDYPFEEILKENH
jgi:hypothetical protein